MKRNEVDPSFLELDLAKLTVAERHQYLLSVVAPRPIALTASINKRGQVNLSPFSYFNAFGASPPYIAISPALSGRDGSPKHTYLNIIETREFTVSVVSHEIVEQSNLASGTYSPGIDEFIKAGFTKKPSKHISVPGVLESPCIMECRLFQHVPLGGKPGSGHLLIGEVLYMYINRSVLDSANRVDPKKMDFVSRLGHQWYSRAREGLFMLPKPKSDACGIGFDMLPPFILNSPILTGRDLARLASVAEVPSHNAETTHHFKNKKERLEAAFKHSEADVHLIIQDLLKQDQVNAAWDVIYFLDSKRSV